ncbi:MAG: PepSY domain-containing protein [Acidobacteriota bacterium]
MKTTALAMTIAMVTLVAVPYAAAQTSAAKEAGQRGKKEAAEKKDAGEAGVQVKDLPPAVKATVAAETKSATLKGLSKEKKQGKTVYELETLVNGRTRDLMIDSAGKVYVIEEQLDADHAPAPVRAALEARGTIVGLESVAENGTTTYEGQVKTKSGKKVTVELDANGKPIKK